MPRMERLLERTIFASRWIMAPIYLGLAISLLLLLFKAVQELAEAIPHLASLSQSEVIVVVLGIIDLSLAGNLVLLVMFAGYENFVSRFKIDHGERPEWMGKIDYSGMKLKLLISIIAISAIHLLRVMINIQAWEEAQLAWMIGIHLTFVASGVLVALSDRLIETTEGHGRDPHIPKDVDVAEGTVVAPAEGEREPDRQSRRPTE